LSRSCCGAPTSTARSRRWTGSCCGWTRSCRPTPRCSPSCPAPGCEAHDGELLLWFVEAGAAALSIDGARRLARDHAVAILAGAPFALTDPSGALRIVEVVLPA
jgi:hypothetical protein